MWRELIGTWGYLAGTNGTATVPAGAIVTQIVVHANTAGSFSIFGGASIPLPANDVCELQFNHSLLVSRTGNTDIVFSSNVTSYYVEYVKAGNT